jgi:hypothetical protein
MQTGLEAPLRAPASPPDVANVTAAATVGAGAGAGAGAAVAAAPDAVVVAELALKGDGVLARDSLLWDAAKLQLLATCHHSLVRRALLPNGLPCRSPT